MKIITRPEEAANSLECLLWTDDSVPCTKLRIFGSTDTVSNGEGQTFFKYFGNGEPDLIVETDAGTLFVHMFEALV